MTRVYYKTGDGQLHCIDADTTDHKTAIWAVGSQLTKARYVDQSKGPLLASLPSAKSSPLPTINHAAGNPVDDEPPRGAA